MHIELLANEGCLNHCPFRATHEALIAAANTGTAIDTFCLNRDLGCMQVLSERPHRILASPFIRPEDVRHYADVADIIKICGRTLGAAFLSRTLTAYASGGYTGNLLNLLDAAHWMAQHWELPNSKLPPDLLLKLLITCDQNCTACDRCQNIFQQHVRNLPLHIAPLK
jgi:collagenase-like PrtC family protease